MRRSGGPQKRRRALNGISRSSNGGVRSGVSGECLCCRHGVRNRPRAARPSVPPARGFARGSTARSLRHVFKIEPSAPVLITRVRLAAARGTVDEARVRGAIWTATASAPMLNPVRMGGTSRYLPCEQVTQCREGCSDASAICRSGSNSAFFGEQDTQVGGCVDIQP
jgi:hypothetical protein